METAAVIIRELRASTGLNRKEFCEHVGIPLRTVEDWEAGRRTPPSYVPRLIEYQLKYEELAKKKPRRRRSQAQNTENKENE
jgi:DNA-binding transcriptional regulator YiaG